jgi:heterotetrameric sarcosine oxidase gamma subunit
LHGLPDVARTGVSWGDVNVLWLSVDQWLILCSRSKASDLAASLTAEFGSIHSLVVNVSDICAIMRLGGDGVREVLLKGSSLDLLSANYVPGPARACALRKLQRSCMSSKTTYSMFSLPLLCRLRKGVPPCNGTRACKNHLVWRARYRHLKPTILFQKTPRRKSSAGVFLP